MRKMECMNFLAACMDCRRSTAAFVGRDDCLLFFEVGKTSADQLADHAGNAAASAAGDNDFTHLAVVLGPLFAKAEINKVIRLGCSLLGRGFWLGHNASLRVVNGVQRMSIDKELFQLAAEMVLKDGIPDFSSSVYVKRCKKSITQTYQLLRETAAEIEAEQSHHQQPGAGS